MKRPRCPWAGSDPLMQAYHDQEWGVPLHEDRALFELLTLEGAQAGLSWRTVLHRRQGYREVFDNFDLERIAAYNPADIEARRADARIIRNRAKIQSTVGNAQASLRAIDELGSLDALVWSYADGRPQRNAFRSLEDLPAETEVSRAMSRDLKRRGFKFVGPTICYAFMQAAGLVNDHLLTCFRYREV